MVANLVPTITALEAEAKASLFLSDHLPDRLVVGNPTLDARAALWQVPVVLVYPVVGIIGQVGEVIIHSQSGEVAAHTPIDAMLALAQSLYDQHQDAIEAAMS